MRILISGGVGFIGPRLTSHWVDLWHMILNLAPSTLLWHELIRPIEWTGRQSLTGDGPERANDGLRKRSLKAN